MAARSLVTGIIASSEREAVAIIGTAIMSGICCALRGCSPAVARARSKASLPEALEC